MKMHKPKQRKRVQMDPTRSTHQSTRITNFSVLLVSFYSLSIYLTQIHISSNISVYEPLYRTKNSTRQVKDHLIIWFSLCALLFVLSSACLSESLSLPSHHKHWSSIILPLHPCLKWPALLLGWKGSR